MLCLIYFALLCFLACVWISLCLSGHIPHWNASDRSAVKRAIRAFKMCSDYPVEFLGRPIPVSSSVVLQPSGERLVEIQYGLRKPTQVAYFLVDNDGGVKRLEQQEALKLGCSLRPPM